LNLLEAIYEPWPKRKYRVRRHPGANRFLIDKTDVNSCMPLLAGDKLDHYEVLSLLGKVRMGEVYCAHNPRLNRDVTIKVTSAWSSERCECEASRQRLR
jgi:hypothetical protein